MGILFSPSNLSFYAYSIHAGSIPSDAVEITPEQHAALLQGQSEGKIITADENGFPILVDPPAPTTEQLASQARAERDARLSDTNWLVERHREEQETGATTLTAQEYTELLAYRQALRDVPQQAGFPETIDWPILPE